MFAPTPFATPNPPRGFRCPYFSADRTSHSKLPPDLMAELQRDTHFDQKEIKQWYYGVSTVAKALVSVGTGLISNRISEGLPVGYFNERRVPKDL